MNIGEVAKSSGMSTKMIRHYEETGLIRAATRTGANYRVYTPRDVQVLRFVRQARHLGFSTKQIAVLLALWEDRSRSSGEVKRLANEHIANLNLRIQELVEMRDTPGIWQPTAKGTHALTVRFWRNWLARRIDALDLPRSERL
jgi:MerR family copper efflux transcriptional regulator